MFSVIAVAAYGFLQFRNHPEVLSVQKVPALDGKIIYIFFFFKSIIFKLTELSLFQDVVEFYRKDPVHFYYASGAIAVSVAVAVWLTTVYMLVKSRAVYLVDFAVASCPDECKVPPILLGRSTLRNPSPIPITYIRVLMLSTGELRDLQPKEPRDGFL